MAKYIVVFNLLFLTLFSSAQSIDKKLSSLRMDQFILTPSYGEFNSDSELSESEFMDWFIDSYIPIEGVQFKLIKRQEDDLGFTHLKFEQHINDYPVYPSILILHIKNGNVESFNAKVYDKVQNTGNLDIMSEKQALAKTLNIDDSEEYKWNDASSEQLLKSIKNDSSATWYPNGELYYTPLGELGNTLQLCYRFSIAALIPNSQHDYFVNASTGDFNYRIPTLVHGDSAGVAVTHYRDTQNIVTDFVSKNSFRLRETKRPIETYDGSIGVDFTDSNNFWNNSGKEIAADVHWGGELVHDFLDEKFGWDSYDDTGGVIKAVCNFGGSGNAFWNLNQNFATYLVGTRVNVGPCAALDVVGHEIGHGIADENASLVYTGESCQLHESYADINGYIIERRGDSTKYDWIVGDQVWNGGIRDMTNPQVYGPSRGCHAGGGVQNYWFYMMTEGDTGINANSFSYSIAGIGLEKAMKIHYRSLFYYITPTAQYIDATSSTLKAAKDLYGVCSKEYQTTWDAWEAVGLVDSTMTKVNVTHELIAPDMVCGKGTIPVSFYSKGDPKRTVLWDFGDGNTSTQLSPVNQYKNTGTYTVTLKTVESICKRVFWDTAVVNLGWKPIASFKELKSQCVNSTDSIEFINETIDVDSTSKVHYFWQSNPLNIQDSSVNFKFPLGLAFKYLITLRAYYDNGCHDEHDQFIEIFDRPKPKFTVKDACEGRSVKLKNLTDTSRFAQSFVWKFDDSTSYSGWQTEKSFSNKGEHIITLESTDLRNNCKGEISDTVEVWANPVPKFTYTNNCVFDTLKVVNATNHNRPINYNFWDLVNARGFNQDTVYAFNYDSTERTILFEIWDDRGCHGVLAEKVPLGKAVAKFEVDTVCFGMETEFENISDPLDSLSYSWDFGDNTAPVSSVSPKHLFGKEGTYNVTLEAENGQCKGSFMEEVLVMEVPITGFNIEDVCSEDTVQLENKTSYSADTVLYEWDFGNGTVSSEFEPVQAYSNSKTETYSVTLKTEGDNGCRDTVVKLITSNEIPYCGFGIDRISTYSKQISFEADSSNYNKYEWEVDGNTSDKSKYLHEFTELGEYTVSLTITTVAGCTCFSESNVTVGLTDIININSNEFVIYPNPASDHVIIKFKNGSGSFTVNVFDALGKRVMDNQLSSEDKLDVPGLSAGVYTLRLITENGSISTFKLLIE